jgi:iron complex transport system permease protein
MYASPEKLQRENRHIRGRLNWLLAIMVLIFAISLLLGRYPGPYLTTFPDLHDNVLAQRLVLNLRLPRILMAMLVGMAMSASGGVFQMVFRNPLVDSGFLGVTAGAFYLIWKTTFFFSSPDFPATPEQF